jgi:hypothetical protein
MNPAFTSRRRADDFDRLVEAAVTGSAATGPVPAELVELAELAASLREVPTVEPRAAFSADLRERLMTAAATELTPAAARTADRLTVRRAEPARRRTERRLTVGIAALAIIGGTAGTALASQSALPGQALYPVKRAIENVRAGFTVGDDAKGSTLLSDAHTRLEEVTKLSRSSSPSSKDQEEISKTLTTFSQQAQKASDLLLSNYQSDHDAASIQKLHDFTAASIDQLTELQPLLPSVAEDALSGAAQALLMIDSAARNLCPTCGIGVTSLPTTLLDPVAKTLDSLGTALGSGLGSSKTPATKHDGPQATLPSVPSNIGPANVDPSTPAKQDKTPSTGPSTKPSSPTAPNLLPSAPTAPPSDLGSLVDGVTGTVGGVLGTVGGVLNGVTGGLLGSPSPK